MRLRGPRGGAVTVLLHFTHHHILYEENGETLTCAALVCDVDADGGETGAAGRAHPADVRGIAGL